MSDIKVFETTVKQVGAKDWKIYGSITGMNNKPITDEDERDERLYSMMTGILATPNAIQVTTDLWENGGGSLKLVHASSTSLMASGNQIKNLKETGSKEGNDG